MRLSDKVLGVSIVRELRAKTAQPILQIGSDTFTRRELSKVECYNFTAAANLSAILNRQLRVKNLREVFEIVSPQDLAVPRLGTISLAVLGAAFEAKGIGGANPLESWVKRHLKNGAALVTFDTLKHRDEKEKAAERREKKRRKRERRDQAHQHRVARFEERTAAADTAS